MIEVTTLNDRKITVNSDLIEIIEEIPDTMITLTTGRKIFVKETRQKVRSLVKSYRIELLSHTFDESEE